MKLNYRKGPWKTEYVEDESRFYVADERTECEDTTVCRIEIYHADGPHQRKATADLISAAPELYQALKILLPFVEDENGKTWDATDEIAAAKDALKKAQGK